MPQGSLYFCFLLMRALKKLHSLQTCFCSPDNLDHTENAASGSGPPARGRSTVTRRHKFDLAARTLLARAGNYFPHPSLGKRSHLKLVIDAAVKKIQTKE